MRKLFQLERFQKELLTNTIQSALKANLRRLGVVISALPLHSHLGPVNYSQAQTVYY